MGLKANCRAASLKTVQNDIHQNIFHLKGRDALVVKALRISVTGEEPVVSFGHFIYLQRRAMYKELRSFACYCKGKFFPLSQISEHYFSSKRAFCFEDSLEYLELRTGLCKRKIFKYSPSLTRDL